MTTRLLLVALERETDIVLIRQRTRRIAELLGNWLHLFAELGMVIDHALSELLNLVVIAFLQSELAN